MTGGSDGGLGGIGDIADLFEGVKSGIEHSGELIGDIGSGHFGEALDDGVSVVRDVGGILESLGGLGVHYGKVATKYVDKLVPLAESKILSAAQLLIDGAKYTTGEGDPDPGDGFKDAADRLQGVVEVLIDANRHEDRWDGAAAEAYESTNHDHRVATSAAQAADERIAKILAGEADQVVRTRENLDGLSEGLHEFDLATMWMNYVPGGAAAKAAMDTTAAAGATAAMQATMLSLFQASVSNAAQIRQSTNDYDPALKDHTGDGRLCGSDIFVKQNEDLERLPTRLKSNAPYELPAPEEPPQWGPPAQPLPAPGTTAPPPARGQR
ncbi:MAG: hypothetical protein KDB71_05695 [Mycobacterium sp.]|nr:hypothetical protein [Mycobacterium sp.]